MYSIHVVETKLYGYASSSVHVRVPPFHGECIKSESVVRLDIVYL